MSTKKEALVFPLNKAGSTPVTAEIMKKRNNPKLQVNFLFSKHVSLDHSSDRNIDSQIFKERSKKFYRLQTLWRKQAFSYGLCLFCFGSTVFYTDEINYYYIYCKHCSEDAWNIKCLSCLEPISYLFCAKCIDAINVSELLNEFNSYIKVNSIVMVERLPIYIPNHTCALCPTILIDGTQSMCPEHETLRRNFSKYQKQLQKEKKCRFCEELLPQGDLISKLWPLCTICRQKMEINPKYCLSCNEFIPLEYKGFQMRVAFTLCIHCVETRADKVVNWKTNESSGERALFKILCMLFEENEIYRYARPYWMPHLQLDFYIPNKKIAFEYDGEQHFKFVKRFHKTKDRFEDQKKRDKEKEELCKLNSVRLIRIRFDDDISLDFIHQLVK